MPKKSPGAILGHPISRSGEAADIAEIHPTPRPNEQVLGKVLASRTWGLDHGRAQ